MKVVIASDSYKESLRAIEVCEAIQRGFTHIYPKAEYVKIPIGDGGEGTVQSLVNASDGEMVMVYVTGPLGREIESFYGLSGDRETAFIEMAAASGLQHVSVEERNPLITTTKGTGELILHALEQGVKRIILGLGGSATNDGGAGMLSALGIQFLEQDGSKLEPVGGNLHKIATIDTTNFDKRLACIQIEAACDVNNPLIGNTGATYVFGPQKGATAEMLDILERNLQHYAIVIQQALQVNVSYISGAGAAGGLGAAVVAFLDGTLRKGIDIVLDYTEFDKHVQNADIVVTGEGRIDEQTAYGKAPVGVAKRAKKYEVPVIAIAGSVSHNCIPVYKEGIDAVFSVVTSAMTLEEAYGTSKENIELTARNIAAVWNICERNCLYSN
ncbi:glycerate kinase [Bacillus manliponensis]|uniref:Glycerate kinase n=1 Tax=Bacillus manliponensis TaxID=574376 RepID=A0A073JSG0_9BACI|nr:glycerate kinase [Bacillus manliponensis]KEK17999.1 glycerate kinase [Bacillus manliponensis]